MLFRSLCTESSSACQARAITREEVAAIVVTTSQLPLNSPNAYSDDDLSVYQMAINAIPYFGMNKCISGSFQFQPSETVSREQFVCILINGINAGLTNNIEGSSDKYSDIGASNFINEIKILGSKNVIPACSSINENFVHQEK